MRFDIMTLFPDMVMSVLSESIIGRAVKAGIIGIFCHNIRDYSRDKHRRVDDAPYGGGNGMVMEPRPIYECFLAISRDIGQKPYVIYMSPKGKILTQNHAKELLRHENITILCGHYEGVDQRIIERIADEEISIGDYVTTGGEIPACILVDVVCRMLPGVLSEEECFTNESHYNGLLEYPQYTRPYDFMGDVVPEILLSGHHRNIERWRRQKSLETTLNNRPDLLQKADLDREDLSYLEERKEEMSRTALPNQADEKK